MRTSIERCFCINSSDSEHIVNKRLKGTGVKWKPNNRKNISKQLGQINNKQNRLAEKQNKKWL